MQSSGRKNSSSELFKGPQLGLGATWRGYGWPGSGVGRPDWRSTVRRAVFGKLLGPQFQNANEFKCGTGFCKL